MELNADQLDALTEIMNIGVGKAGNALSELVGTEILLQVPRVDVFRVDSLPDARGLRQEGSLALVSQSFRGGLDGQAILVFPKQSAIRLASLLADQSFLKDAEINDDCQGILLEVGNILLNAVLGTIGNMVSESLSYEVPAFAQRSFSEIIQEFASSDEGSSDARVLQVEASFTVHGQCISGRILVFCKLESLEQLLAALFAA